jgi:hypothetical protein
MHLDRPSTEHKIRKFKAKVHSKKHTARIWQKMLKTLAFPTQIWYYMNYGYYRKEYGVGIF